MEKVNALSKYTDDLQAQIGESADSVERIVYLVDNGLLEQLEPLYSGRSDVDGYVKVVLRKFVKGIRTAVPETFDDLRYRTIENIRGFEKSMGEVINTQLASKPRNKKSRR